MHSQDPRPTTHSPQTLSSAVQVAAVIQEFERQSGRKPSSFCELGYVHRTLVLDASQLVIALHE